MSLVPTWVRATDGKYYKDPVLRERDWFLCFDDNEPPELVVKWKEGDDLPSFWRRAETILKELGLQYRFLSKRPALHSRDFGNYRLRSGSISLHYAGSVFLEITAPIPVPQEYGAVGTYHDVLRTECVLYSFNKQ